MAYNGSKYADLSEIFLEMSDQRRIEDGKGRFSHLALMCIYAALAGKSGAEEIAQYMMLNFKYFDKILEIENLPIFNYYSKILEMETLPIFSYYSNGFSDIVLRVLHVTDFDGLSASLGGWLRGSFPELCEKHQGKKALPPVDGKGRAAGEKPVYYLNAMYENGSVGVEMRPAGENEDEEARLLEYLKQFQLSGTVVAVNDAVGYSQAVIDAIHSRGGNYVLPVKESQKRLFEAVNEKIRELEKDGRWDKILWFGTSRIKNERRERSKFSALDKVGVTYEELGLGSFYGTAARICVMDLIVYDLHAAAEDGTKSRSIFITDREELPGGETLYQILASFWNMEMQRWLLDIHLKGEWEKGWQTAGAVTDESVLRQFCMAVKEQDAELSKEPVEKFWAANEQDPGRIEKLLFGEIANRE